MIQPLWPFEKYPAGGDRRPMDWAGSLC